MARKKAKRYEDGGEIVVSGSRAEDARALDRMMREPSFVGGSLVGRFGDDSGGGGGGGGGSSSSKMSVGKVRTPVGKVFGLRDIPVGKGNFSVGASPFGGGKVGGTFKTSFKKGGKLTDLTGDGGTSDKPKPKIVPLPTSPRRVPPSLLPTKPPSKDRGIKKYAKGGPTASKRGDGCATKGKTKGKFV